MDCFQTCLKIYEDFSETPSSVSLEILPRILWEIAPEQPSNILKKINPRISFWISSKIASWIHLEIIQWIRS